MIGGGAVNALFEVYAREGLRLGALGYGGLLSAHGVGSVVGALIMGIIGAYVSWRKMFFLGILGAAVAPALWAVSPGFLFSAVVGVLNAAANGSLPCLE